MQSKLICYWNGNRHDPVVEDSTLLGLHALTTAAAKIGDFDLIRLVPSRLHLGANTLVTEIL